MGIRFKAVPEREDFVAIRDFISRLASNSPSLFYGLKRADLVFHFLLRKQFEPEFLCLTDLGQSYPDLRIVDVGGNIGQSAIGLSQIFSASEITSFEANPDLEPYLALCSSLLGQRYRYHMVGLSECTSQMTLHVPRRGAVYIYGEAAVDPAALADPSVEARIGKFEVTSRTIMLRKFDELGLRPDIVKIDVQGHEMAVLAGMSQAIDECKPYFVIERSHDDAKIQSWLKRAGYQAFLPEACRRLVPYSPEHRAVNMFLIPVDCASRRAQNRLLV